MNYCYEKIFVYLCIWLYWQLSSYLIFDNIYAPTRCSQKYKQNKTLYYQFNSVKQHATKRWEVIKYTHVLQFSLEWRDLSEETTYCKDVFAIFTCSIYPSMQGAVLNHNGWCQFFMQQERLQRPSCSPTGIKKITLSYLDTFDSRNVLIMIREAYLWEKHEK